MDVLPVAESEVKGSRTPAPVLPGIDSMQRRRTQDGIIHRRMGCAAVCDVMSCDVLRDCLRSCCSSGREKNLPFSHPSIYGSLPSDSMKHRNRSGWTRPGGCLLIRTLPRVNVASAVSEGCKAGVSAPSQTDLLINLKSRMPSWPRTSLRCRHRALKV
jgi:hypothetical protein